jgi:histone deacetylase 1/2
MVVKLTKALYGCIESARLWYREISTALKSIGYTPNVKDICVFNKVVDGVQCTITLHVDDLMVTSVTEGLIDEVMNLLRYKYERPGAKLDVKEGKLHNYLGMTFDFTIDGEVNITMNKYITEVLKFTEIKGCVATPATTDLYSIVASDPLDSDKREYFHSVVAKLLYLSKRVRPDLLTAVGFLAKRVTVSTKMDSVKLERVLRYLNGTSHLGLTLRPSDNLSILSYIDASYAVHHDMKSQTGVAITLGEGITYSKSTTQQLNSKSSTEAELIALTDAAGHVIWVRDYLIGQGYKIGPATVFQDNMSTMALVKKGYSTSNNTRHINIRYFFIKDRVDTEELKIEYLPTEDMIADFFTKPLQGELFKTLRGKVLGVKVDKKHSYIAYI